MIVRPRQHSRGRMLFFCSNRDELVRAIQRCGIGSYISAYVQKTAEFRVFVANGRCVAVAEKIPSDAQMVAWNVDRGGKFEHRGFDNWPLKAVRISIDASNALGLHFGAIDVMTLDSGAWVLEANTAPSMESPYRLGCMIKVLRYMLANGSDPIPLVSAKGGWRKFIHPAISTEALL